MSAEKRPEVTSFINNWAGKPKDQVVEELASYALETKRIPDPYYFEMDEDGDIFSPSSGCKLKDIIRTDNLVGQLEAEAFDSISNWFREENFGTIAWISPPYPGLYPTSKVIVSQIESGGKRKRLFNKAIVLDIDENECLQFGQQLSQFSKKKPFLTHSDQLRATPIILAEEESWVNIFGRLISKEAAWNTIREGRDIVAKREAILEAQRVFSGQIDVRKGILEMLGEKGASCPVLFTTSLAKLSTAFEAFSANSLIFGAESYHFGSCVICNRGNVLVGGCKICTSCEKKAA